MKRSSSRGGHASDGMPAGPAIQPAELRRQTRFAKQGRGQGSGASYEPYIQIERSGFQSRGRSHYFFNPQLGRHHHLLSDLELLTFLWAWSFQAMDYREQFPLQRFEFDPLFMLQPKRARGTIEIAKSMGIKHPSITKNDPRIMTTDLLVTFADRTHFAIHAKYMKDQIDASDRQIDLKSIEKQYWRDRSTKFIVADETYYTEGRAGQMMWATDGMNWRGSEETVTTLLHFLARTSPRAPMGERLYATAWSIGLVNEDAVRAFKFAVLTRRWSIELGTELDLSKPWPGRASRATPVISARGFQGAFK